MLIAVCAPHCRTFQGPHSTEAKSTGSFLNLKAGVILQGFGAFSNCLATGTTAKHSHQPVPFFKERRAALRGHAAPVALQTAHRVAHTRVRLPLPAVLLVVLTCTAASPTAAAVMQMLQAVVIARPSLAVSVLAKHTATSTVSIVSIVGARALSSSKGRAPRSAALRQLQQQYWVRASLRSCTLMKAAFCSCFFCSCSRAVMKAFRVAKAAAVLALHTSQGIVIIYACFSAVLPRLLHRRLACNGRCYGVCCSLVVLPATACSCSIEGVLVLLQSRMSDLSRLSVRCFLCFSTGCSRLRSSGFRFCLCGGLRRSFRFYSASA